MAKKSKKTGKVSKFTAKVSPTKAFAILFVALFAIIGASYVFASSAAPPIPTGTMTLNPSSTLKYGGNLVFDTTVSGKMSPKAQVYITTVCSDSANPGKVIYQWSKGVYSNYGGSTPQVSFPLIDQGGQGLQWDGQAAVCGAWLIYRVDGGKIIIEPLVKLEGIAVTAAQ